MQLHHLNKHNSTKGKITNQNTDTHKPLITTKPKPKKTPQNHNQGPSHPNTPLNQSSSPTPFKLFQSILI